MKSTSVLHVYPEEKNLIWWEIRATKELLVDYPLRRVCRLRKVLVFLFAVSYHTGKNGHRVKRPLRRWEIHDCEQDTFNNIARLIDGMMLLESS